MIWVSISQTLFLITLILLFKYVINLSEIIKDTHAILDYYNNNLKKINDDLESLKHWLKNIQDIITFKKDKK